jgi:alkanesulfonate monooxygenase SsuD/methylene tetrahydromethanopterin reductase-like flavin-dependent oxidoreductase (luciferase family)
VLALHGWEGVHEQLHAASRRGEWKQMAELIDDDMLAAFAAVGSPAEVAAQLAPYVEAGVDWISPADYLPVVLPLDEAAGALPRAIAVCEHLKALAATRP